MATEFCSAMREGGLGVVDGPDLTEAEKKRRVSAVWVSKKKP